MGLWVVGAMNLLVVVCGGCKWIWLSWARCSNFLCCLWLQPCNGSLVGAMVEGFFFFFFFFGCGGERKRKNKK